MRGGTVELQVDNEAKMYYVVVGPRKNDKGINCRHTYTGQCISEAYTIGHAMADLYQTKLEIKYLNESKESK